MNEAANSLEVLLVEDNPHDLELALRALKKNHLVNHIQVARDGVEALEFLFGTGQFEGRDVNDHPRVVFLDLKLPRVDGLEVLRRLRADERTRMIPVVVLTSSAEEKDRIESYHLGVNSYVVKPVDFENFASAVQQLGFYWLLLNRPPKGE